jgi:hypothetical protein
MKPVKRVTSKFGSTNCRLHVRLDFDAFRNQVKLTMTEMILAGTRSTPTDWLWRVEEDIWLT